MAYNFQILKVKKIKIIAKRAAFESPFFIFNEVFLYFRQLEIINTKGLFHNKSKLKHNIL